MTVSVIKRWLSEATSLGDGTWSWPRFWWPFICIAILVAYFAIAALAVSIVGFAIAIAVFGGLPVAVLMGGGERVWRSLHKGGCYYPSPATI